MKNLKNFLTDYEEYLPALTGLALLIISIIGMMIIATVTHFEKYG